MTRIGSKFISLSTEGAFLDGPSIQRIQNMLAKPPKKPTKLKPTPEPRVEAVRKKWAAGVEEAERKYVMRYKDWSEFGNAKLVRMATKMHGLGLVTERVFIIMELGPATIYGDIITGTLYSDTGRCLSSARLQICGQPFSISKKDAAKYIKAKGKNFDGEE